MRHSLFSELSNIPLRTKESLYKDYDDLVTLIYKLKRIMFAEGMDKATIVQRLCFPFRTSNLSKAFQ